MEMIDMRADKTTRNGDDFKVLAVGILCAIMILMGSVLYPRFLEQRWFRDITRITPFYEATLLFSNVSDDNIEITLGGSLIKRRCVFNDLYGYIYGDNGIRYRVPVDTSQEDATGQSGNRPPSDEPESWGPWTMDLDDNQNIPVTVIPQRWEIIAEHVECPTPPETQRNLFISGDWDNFILVTEDNVEEMIEIIEEETL